MAATDAVEVGALSKSTNSDIYWLKKAADAALGSTLRFRVGCHVNQGGWSTNSCNLRKSHPKLRKWGFPHYSNIHAEMAVVIKEGDGLADSTIYVTRLLRDGSWALAKPCVYCMGVLVACKVYRVVWSTGPLAGEALRLS